MFVATVIVSVLLAVALIGSARGKLVKQPQVMQGMTTVGVPENRVPQLAFLELAGAAGLLIGLFWWPLGVAAAAGVVLYFVGALGAHARVRDRGFPPALVFFLVAVAALVLRYARR